MTYALEAVRKIYPSRAGGVSSLDTVSFAVGRGERVALIGASGAGKTTLFRLLNATLRPSAGVVRFEGRDLATLSPAQLRATRRRIGTVFQQVPLVPSLTALQNALCGRLGSWGPWSTLRALVSLPRAEIERGLAALRAVGLEGKARARADELSGGQQQRVAVARVLVQDPDVVLADEPFASLDPALTETIAALLLGVAEGRTLICTLHDVELALRFFPRVIGLARGRVAFDAKAADVTRPMLDALYAGAPLASVQGRTGEGIAAT